VSKLKKQIEIGQHVEFFLQGEPERIAGIVSDIYSHGVIGVLVDGKKYGVHTSALSLK
jgi:hypothetical protein